MDISHTNISKMDKENNEELKKFELDPQGFVSLPFSERDFKEFIVGLLGKPETIDATLEGGFEIDAGNIKDLFILINQRVKQQNESTLIQFSAQIVFDNESSVTLNSIESLISYKEIRPIISKELHITFQYLIKFHNKNVPERQEINVSFLGYRESAVSRPFKAINILSLDTILDKKFRKKRYQQGYIQFNIKHTARTWGTDISSLLENYFRNLLFKEDRYRIWIRRNWVFLSLMVFLIISSLGFYTGERMMEIGKSKRDAIAKEIFERSNITLTDISEQIRFVAIKRKSDDAEKGVVIIFCTGLFAVLSMLIVNESIANNKKSFVLLTQKSIEEKEIKNKKYSRQWLYFFLSVIVSIGSSMIANYLFIYFVIE